MLLQDGPITMGRAAELLAIQPPTVTKMVSRLAAAGLVRTDVMDRDRRKVAVSLTETARERIADIDSIWRVLEEEALRDVDREPLKASLGAVVRNLTENGGEHASRQQ